VAHNDYRDSWQKFMPTVFLEQAGNAFQLRGQWPTRMKSAPKGAYLMGAWRGRTNFITNRHSF
jgi:hypothetical protein